MMHQLCIRWCVSMVRPQFDHQRLGRHRLDRRLKALRGHLSRLSVPNGGWVRAIRQALMMTAEDLARRMRIGPSSVSRMEASEDRETIQIDTLRRAAAALDCELVYVLVPKTSLQETVDRQRLKRATELARKARIQMVLEGEDMGDDSSLPIARCLSLIRDSELWKDEASPTVGNNG